MSYKILMVTPHMEQGGTESYIINLSQYLSQNHYEVVVASDGGIREKQLNEISVKHE